MPPERLPDPNPTSQTTPNPPKRPRKPRKPALYRPKPFEPIHVRWVDALYDGDFDGKPAHYTPEAPILDELGFFVKQDKDTFVMAACYDSKTGTVRWLMNLPIGLIAHIKPLDLS